MPYGSIAADKITTSDGFTLGGSGATMKNRLINGDFRIDQRNAGASVTVSTTSNVFGPDRWYGTINGGNVSIQQTSTVPNNNFRNSVKITTTTASTPASTGEYAAFHQAIEGLNIGDLGWGTSDAEPVTLSFWSRASQTGKYNITLVNHNGSRCNPGEFTVSSANTWAQYSITFSGDTGGSWQANNQTGLVVRVGLGDSDGYNGTVNTWNNSAGGYIGIQTAGSVKLKATLGADLYFAGMQLEAGSTATSYDYRHYGNELALCQRYYAKSYAQGTVPATNTPTGASTMFCSSSGTGYMVGGVTLPVTMRVSPAITLYTVGGTAGSISGGDTTTNLSGAQANQIGDRAFSIQNNSGGTYSPNGNLIYAHWVASAEV
jgi:hypothetical protein